MGGRPEGVAVAPDGTFAYVTNEASANVSVIDTATNTVVGTPIPVDWPCMGRLHSEREIRLGREYWLQQCFGDQDGQQGGGDPDPGGS
jgi:YVTN family beta-propeller protein